MGAGDAKRRLCKPGLALERRLSGGTCSVLEDLLERECVGEMGEVPRTTLAYVRRAYWDTDIPLPFELRDRFAVSGV